MNTKEASFIYKQANKDMAATTAGAVAGLLSGLAFKKWVLGKDKKMSWGDALTWGGGGAALGGLAGYGLANSNLTEDEVAEHTALKIDRLNERLEELYDKDAPGVLDALGLPTLFGAGGWIGGKLTGKLFGSENYTKTLSALGSKLSDARIKASEAASALQRARSSKYLTQQTEAALRQVRDKIQQAASRGTSVTAAARAAMESAARTASKLQVDKIIAESAAKLAEARSSIKAIQGGLLRNRFGSLSQGHGGVFSRLAPWLASGAGVWFGWDRDKFNNWVEGGYRWYNPQYNEAEDIRSRIAHLKSSQGGE